MLDAFILALREGLEAALVVGIILAQLAKQKKKGLMCYVNLGVFVGVLLCLLAGGFFFVLLRGQEYQQNPIFEGSILLFSALFIAYLPYWLHRNSSQTAIESKLAKNTSAAALFLLSFFTVFREGSELAVFILVKIKDNAPDIAAGVLLGIFAAIVVAMLVFKLSVRLNLTYLFTALSFFLIYIGGDLFTQGLSKLFNTSAAVQVLAMWLFIAGSAILLLWKPVVRWFSQKQAATNESKKS